MAGGISDFRRKVNIAENPLPSFNADGLEILCVADPKLVIGRNRHAGRITGVCRFDANLLKLQCRRIDPGQSTRIRERPNESVFCQSQFTNHGACQPLALPPDAPGVRGCIPHGQPFVGPHPEPPLPIAQRTPDNVVRQAFRFAPARPGRGIWPAIKPHASVTDPDSALTVLKRGKDCL